MPKQGKNIYLRKDRRWEGRYINGRIDGRIRYGYVFGKTYEDALNKLTRDSGTRKRQHHAESLCSSIYGG